MVKVFAVSLGIVLKISPLARDVRARVKDHDAAIHRVLRRVLLYDAHDAADELHEGRQIAEDAEYRCDGQIFVVKAFAELADLNDHVQIMVFELLQHAFIGGTISANARSQPAFLARCMPQRSADSVRN